MALPWGAGSADAVQMTNSASAPVGPGRNAPGANAGGADQSLCPLGWRVLAGELRRTAVAALGRRRRVLATWLRRCRPRLECTALLAALVALSMTVGWLSWQATGTVRERRADAAAQEAQAAEATLVTDLTTDLVAERRTGAEPYTTRRRPPDASGGPAGAGEPARSASPGAGGVLVSVGAVGAALLPCLLAALVVVRRYRRAAGADAAADAGSPPVAEDRRVALREELSAPESEAAAAQVPAEPLSTDASSAVPHADAGTSVSEASPSASGTRRTTTPQVADRYGATPAYASRERVFERRAAPRIAYECDGRLHGRQSDSPITVVDLSETGLRCRSSSSTLPKPTEFVVVTFALDDGEITLTGQVSWRRANPEGHEVGVQFQRLSPEDTARLRATCLQTA